VLSTVILGLKVSGLAVALGYLLSFMISPLGTVPLQKFSFLKFSVEMRIISDSKRLLYTLMISCYIN
jgi:hypothetical protein